MNIGKESEVITIEPVQDPVPESRPVEPAPPVEAPEPARP
jgi:hypothetical protein